MRDGLGLQVISDGALCTDCRWCKVRLRPLFRGVPKDCKLTAGEALWIPMNMGGPEVRARCTKGRWDAVPLRKLGKRQLNREARHCDLFDSMGGD